MSATAPLTPGVVNQLLGEYGALTRAALKEYLPEARPSRYLYDLLRIYPERGGKMMRSTLCIATAKAFGASTEQSVRTAAAIELLHNALLIHDDIQDESELRRGAETLHQLYEVPLAINAGDALCLMSLRPLLDNRFELGPSRSLRILEEAQRMAIESAEGQALELGWQFDNVLELDASNYLEMVLKKTCWLATIYPMRVGAIIARGAQQPLDRFIHFGFLLGAAFQIQDDLLNLYADNAYGKELNGDLWEGKRTLMLMHVWQHADASGRRRIKRIMSEKRQARSGVDIHWLRRRMDRYGSIRYARQLAHALAGAASVEFERLYGHLPESDDKAFVRGLPTWVFERA